MDSGFGSSARHFDRGGGSSRSLLITWMSYGLGCLIGKYDIDVVVIIELSTSVTHVGAIDVGDV